METNNDIYNQYIAWLFAPQAPALTATLTDMGREKVPAMNVSAAR